MTIVHNREAPSPISHVEAMIIAHEACLDRACSLQMSANPNSALLTQAAPPLVPPVPPSASLPVPSEANYASSSVDSSYDDRSYEDRSDDRGGYGDSRNRGGYSGRGGHNSRGGGYGDYNV